MPKYDFNKVAKQRYWNHTSAWVLSCKFAGYYQNTFYYENLWMAASGSQKFYKPVDVLSVTNAVEEIEVSMIFLLVTFFVGR